MLSHQRNLLAKDFCLGEEFSDLSHRIVLGTYKKVKQTNNFYFHTSNEQTVTEEQNKIKLARGPSKTITNRFSLLRWLHLFPLKKCPSLVRNSKQSKQQNYDVSKGCSLPWQKGVIKVLGQFRRRPVCTTGQRDRELQAKFKITATKNVQMPLPYSGTSYLPEDHSQPLLIFTISKLFKKHQS